MFITVSFEYCAGDYAKYSIYDSDFENEKIEIEVKKVTKSFNPFQLECVKCIIDVYEKRNLNVAHIIFKWITSTGNIKYLQDIKNHLPEYSKYAEDVEKYLMLM
jgi:hypothetical protein